MERLYGCDPPCSGSPGSAPVSFGPGGPKSSFTGGALKGHGQLLTDRTRT